MRKQIESSVVAVNKHLKETVSQMSLMELLRNCHPLYRDDYARALHRAGQISKSEMESITKQEKIQKPISHEI